MAKSIDTRGTWAPRRPRGEQDGIGALLSSPTSDVAPGNGLFDSWREQLLRELRRQHQRELESRNEELRQARAELVHAAEERLRMRDRLLHLQKMEAIGTLASGLAHDINNVLAAILLFGSSLERRMPSGHPGKEDAAEIVAAALHGKELTQALLNFSHRGPRHKEFSRPSEVIARLVLLLRRMVGKRIAINARVDDAVAAIECDSGQFMQMLLNLCLNSIDAIPHRGTITIAASNVLPQDAELRAAVGRTSIPYVRIEIADDGVGMDADTRQHAFEPFFTTKALGKGTGLGLFMVHDEVQELHGTVRIDSEPNRGTSVHILLPVPLPQPPPPV